MSERSSPVIGVAPVADRSGRITGVGRLIFVSFGLVGISLGFTLMKPDQAEPFVLGLLAILAVIGLVALLAGAIGIIRFSIRTESDDLGKALLDATGEGVLISDREGRIVFANRAYAELTGAPDAQDLRSVERAFAGNAEAAEAIYRITQTLREGNASQEEVRLPAPLGAVAAAGPRWY